MIDCRQQVFNTDDPFKAADVFCDSSEAQQKMEMTKVTNYNYMTTTNKLFRQLVHCFKKEATKEEWKEGLKHCKWEDDEDNSGVSDNGVSDKKQDKKLDTHYNDKDQDSDEDHEENGL